MDPWGADPGQVPAHHGRIYLFGFTQAENPALSFSANKSRVSLVGETCGLPHATSQPARHYINHSPISWQLDSQGKVVGEGISRNQPWGGLEIKWRPISS